MERGGRIALVAHCVLNINARVAGIAGYAGVHPVVERLARAGYGIVQLPCPEFEVQGLGRPPMAVEDYDTPPFREHCVRIAEETRLLVETYREAGVSVALVVGVEGSPSCGVSLTNVRACDAPADGAPAGDDGKPTRRAPGPGVLARALREQLEPLGVVFVAVDSREADQGTGRVLAAAGI